MRGGGPGPLFRTHGHFVFWSHGPLFFGVMGLFFGPLGKNILESWASFLDPLAKICWTHGPLFWTPRQFFHDFLKTKKMRNVCTINLAVVSRRDLYYVSENESFCFGQNIWISRSPGFQTPPPPPPPPTDEPSDPNLTPLPTRPGIKYVARVLAATKIEWAHDELERFRSYQLKSTKSQYVAGT